MDFQEDSAIERPSRRSLGVSKPFVIGVAAVAVLLGFALGLMSSSSTGNLAGGSSALYDEELVTALVEEASPAVVELNVVQRRGRLRLPRTGSGSGFLVDREGRIVTNHHVVDRAEEITVKLLDGRTLEAEKLGTSPADDLALLQVDPEQVSGIEPLPLADSGDLKTGQMAIAIGSPFHNFNSVTVGVVSGTGRGPSSILRRPIPDMIQTDAPLNPGNSGGPLLNSDGQVIGVNSSVRTGTFQGLDDFRVGFAVPSNTVASLLPDLREPKQVRRPWLGISGGSVGGELVVSPDLPRGIHVTSVFSGSPAARAGLVPAQPFGDSARGDVITAVDGRPLDSVEDMVSYFNTRRPGDEVTLSVFRDGRTIELDVTLAEWPDT
ncbi:MAG: S1C family serine protease [Nitrospinota bacterium]